jgi:hypothetical protein
MIENWRKALLSAMLEAIVQVVPSFFLLAIWQ